MTEWESDKGCKMVSLFTSFRASGIHQLLFQFSTVIIIITLLARPYGEFSFESGTVEGGVDP
jgi:hypothetical protein